MARWWLDMADPTRLPLERVLAVRQMHERRDAYDDEQLYDIEWSSMT